MVNGQGSTFVVRMKKGIRVSFVQKRTDVRQPPRFLPPAIDGRYYVRQNLDETKIKMHASTSVSRTPLRSRYARDKRR